MDKEAVMTVEKMIEVLIDKGHSREYAETLAPLDVYELNHPDYERRVPREDCSICRRTFTTVEMRYHYHPCE